MPAASASRSARQFLRLMTVPAEGSSVPSMSMAMSFGGKAIAFSLAETCRYISRPPHGGGPTKVALASVAFCSIPQQNHRNDSQSVNFQYNPVENM
jgi:hypothetical protein